MNALSLILTDVKSGNKVEARLTQSAEGKGKRFGALSKKARNCKAGSSEHLAMKKKIDAILDWLRTAPDSEVVTVRALK